MALRISTALRDFLLQHGSLKNALQNGKILVYSGAQPATADAAPTGTLLCVYTDNSGAHTPEVLATGTVTLATGASGSVDTITVNGVNIIAAPVPFNTSLTQTAADLATAINKGISSPEYTATSSGTVVTISAMRGSGSAPNGFVVTGTLTTMTASYGNMAGGTDAVNGLQLDNAAAGSISKRSDQTWSGAAVAGGTAGWFRFVGSVTDSGIADSTESQIRMDGSVSTSGAQLNLSSTTIAATATQTISGFTASIPAQ